MRVRRSGGIPKIKDEPPPARLRARGWCAVTRENYLKNIVIVKIMRQKKDLPVAGLISVMVLS